MGDDNKPLFGIGAKELDKRLEQANRRARQEGTNREGLLLLVALAVLLVYGAWTLWRRWTGSP